MPPNRLAFITTVSWMGSVAALYVIRLIGSSWYDFQQINKQRERRRHPNAKQYRNKPFISVIVIAQNEEETIEATLKSLINNNYKKYEVIVVDNGSTDNTANSIREFIKSHKKYALKLVSKRHPVLAKSAVQSALTKRPKGSLIMLLDGKTTLDEQALKTAVQHFAEGDISVLLPYTRIQEYPGLIGLLQQFEQPLATQISKLGLANRTDITGGYGVIYKKAALTKLKRFIGTDWSNDNGVEQASRSFVNKPLSAYFASDVIISVLPLQSYKDLFRHYRLLAAGSIKTLTSPGRVFKILSQSGFIRRVRPLISVLNALVVIAEPLVVGYLAYLVIKYKSPAFYLIVWLSMSTLLGLAFLREQPTGRDRFKKILLLPIMYNLVLAARLMQIGAFCTYILNFKRWTKTNKKTLKPLRKTTKKTKKKNKLAVAQ